MTGTKTIADLCAENDELRRRLVEAEETLLANRAGSVHAFDPRGPHGEHVYAQEGAERPYHLLIENLQQGAVIVRADGTILYCNRRFAELVQVPSAKLAGACLLEFVPAGATEQLEALLSESGSSPTQGEIRLSRADGAWLPVHVACNPLRLNGSDSIAVLVTDLVEKAARRRAEHLAERLTQQQAVAAELAQAITV